MTIAAIPHPWFSKLPSSSFPRHHVDILHRVHHSPLYILSSHGHGQDHSLHTSPTVQALVLLTSSSFPRVHSLHILCRVHSLHSLHSLYTRDRIHHCLHMLSMSPKDQHLHLAEVGPRPQRGGLLQ